MVKHGLSKRMVDLRLEIQLRSLDNIFMILTKTVHIKSTKEFFSVFIDKSIS